MPSRQQARERERGRARNGEQKHLCFIHFLCVQLVPRPIMIIIVIRSFILRCALAFSLLFCVVRRRRQAIRNDENGEAAAAAMAEHRHTNADSNRFHQRRALVEVQCDV